MLKQIKLITLDFFNGFSWPLVFGLLSATATLIWTSWQPSMDPDTHMHITIGKWIYENRSIPTTDIYSHTLFGRPWAVHEWLSELIFYIVYRLGGWTALVLIMSLALAATLAITLRFLLYRVPPLYAIFFTALTYSALATHLLIRAHVLTWPLLAIWTATLIKSYEEVTIPPWYLLPLITLWANLHGSFIIGIALAILIAFQAVHSTPKSKQITLLKGWLIFISLSLLLCSFTPAGLKGLIFPFLLFSSHYLKEVDEWMPYRFGSFNGLEFSLFTFFSLALMGLIKLNLIFSLVIVGLLYEALTHNRYVSIFGLITPFFIAQSFGYQYVQAVEKNTNKSLTKVDQFFVAFTKLANYKAVLTSFFFIIFIGFIESQLHRHEPSETIFPVTAVDFVKTHNIRGPVLNSYEFGGYLISRDIPVFIDGRVDLYDAEILGPYLKAVRDGSPAALGALIEKYKISWILIRPNSLARSYFEDDKGWRKVYEDKVAIIYMKAS